MRKGNPWAFKKIDNKSCINNLTGSLIFCPRKLDTKYGTICNSKSLALGERPAGRYNQIGSELPPLPYIFMA